MGGTFPSLGADMDEAMLVAWLVEPGDPVEHGQVIAEVEEEWADFAED